MKRALMLKLKEATVSVMPVTLIVLFLYFTPFVDLTAKELTVFLISAVFLTVGIGFFSLGADVAMTPMGEKVGSGLTKSRNLPLLLSVAFVMGLLITIAEPDLTVLAEQLQAVINPTTLIVTVGVGVGIFLLVSVLKIVIKTDLSLLITFFYFLTFSIAALLLENGKGVFLPSAFDSGGVTTGPITVPFIMALGVGVASTVGGKNSSENSFGLIALCSIGPILAVMALSLFSNGELGYELPNYSIDSSLGAGFMGVLSSVTLEVVKALGLIVVFFAVLQVTVLKLPKGKIIKIAIGIGYTLLGLITFLTAVQVGFMPVGFKLGVQLAESSPVLIVVFGIILGAVVVLAEPAVHVLNKQVEDITGGRVSKRSMLIALSVGVGVSIGLSMIRMIFKFSVLYYLIPGYLIALGLSLFVPKIYSAIAFDSGGVASGPLTSTFILPLAIGVCTTLAGVEGVLSYAFGIVAMVAMTPLITIQALGFRAIVAEKMRNRVAMRRILASDDEQIINF